MMLRRLEEDHFVWPAADRHQADERAAALAPGGHRHRCCAASPSAIVPSRQLSIACPARCGCQSCLIKRGAMRPVETMRNSGRCPLDSWVYPRTVTAAIPCCDSRKEVTLTRLTREEFALVLADRHIREALQRIVLQEKRVHEQQECGRDSSQAEKLLCLTRDVLCSFTEHRRLIEEELERERRLLKNSGP